MFGGDVQYRAPNPEVSITQATSDTLEALHSFLTISTRVCTSTYLFRSASTQHALGRLDGEARALAMKMGPA